MSGLFVYLPTYDVGSYIYIIGGKEQDQLLLKDPVQLKELS